MANFLYTLRFLLWAEILERYALLVLISYLTDVWELGLTYVVGLINICVGIKKSMPLVFLFLIDKYTGSYWMLLISTSASSIGMGLLSISTPSFLYSRITGSCCENSPKCISQRQKSLFYVALAFIIIGQSAREATKETLKFKGNAYEQEEKRKEVNSGTQIVTVIAGFVLPMIKPWSIRFAIPAICNLLVARLLMGKSWSHKLYIDIPQRNPAFTTVSKAFMTSTSRMFQDNREKTASRSQDIKGNPSLLPISTLTYVGNDEILRPTYINRHDKWTIMLMILVCVMFIFLGLVSSIGNTYFIEQAKRLNPKVILGEEYTVSFLVMTHDIIRIKRIKKDIKKYRLSRNQSDGVLLAYFYASICCLIAAAVERRRLNMITRYGLVNKPGDINPMTIFWFWPQFYALGLYDGMFQQTISKYVTEEIPSSMRSFATLFSQALIGLGAMSSVLFVYVIGKISEMGGRQSWFQENTEKSRLDKFYLVLTTLCLVVFRVWAQLCKHKNGYAWRKMETLSTLCVGIIFLSLLLFPEVLSKSSDVFLLGGFYFETMFLCMCLWILYIVFVKTLVKQHFYTR